MSIRETVKQALPYMAGNKSFCIADLITTTPLNQHEELSSAQVSRAFRDIPYVRRTADGRYVVKGRRVPPKVDITKPEIGV